MSLTVSMIGRIVLPALLAIAVAVPGAPRLAFAEQKKAPPVSGAQIRLSFAPVVKKVAPAVVNVYTRIRLAEGRMSPFRRDPFYRRFLGDGARDRRRRAQRQRSLGSGVIVRSDGLIVTNHHVIRQAQQIIVRLQDRREYRARVLVSDRRTDLAVLKIDAGGRKLPVLAIGDSDTLEVGDLVLAVGNPFGVGQTVTSGIVSALARTSIGISDYRSFIQTDAAINPGNSGGALVTVDGKLIGINTAIYSRSGGSLGIGFAIPSNMVRAVVRAAMKGGPIRRPWLGVSGQGVTADMASALGLERVGGVIVKQVTANSPGARAGIRNGDVIVEMGKRPVADIQDLRFRLATLAVGDTVTLTVIRRKARRTLTVRLERAPENPPRNLALLGGRTPFSGATVANLSPAVSEELELPALDIGVVITRIQPRTPAQFAGLRPKDVIIAVNGQRINTVSGLKTILQRDTSQWRVQLRRGRRVLVFNFRS